MKCLLLFLCLISTLVIQAQTTDSIVIKQVDSLIKISRELTGKQDFEKALEVNSIAEKLAIEKLGKETASFGSVCFDHGRIMYYKQDYLESEKWYLKSKAIREKVLGKESRDYAQTLHNLALIYGRMGQFENAVSFFTESKAIREKVLGKEHRDYLASTNNLAMALKELGDFQKAEYFYLESKVICEKVLGKETSQYAWIINDLAILYSDKGNYDKAELYYLEAKEIQEKVVGKEHPDYATSLLNLGNLYTDKEDFKKAESYCLESTEIYKKIYGRDHLEYSKGLNQTGILYLIIGQYEKAENLLLESAAIRERLLGKEHSDYAASISNLALLYNNMGLFEKSEIYHLNSKEIFEKVVGKNNIQYARCINNLAKLYVSLGLNEKAEVLYFESLTIKEKILGKENSDYAGQLNNLAILFQKKGNYEKAEIFLLEAKGILEKVLGREHLQFAGVLNSLAVLYRINGQYEKAEAYYIESKNIRENVQGKKHPDFAWSINNLGLLYFYMGQYEKAEILFLESKVIREELLGKEHPDYINNLNNLANLYVKTKQFEKAELFFTESSQRNRLHISSALHHLSEKEMNQYILTFIEEQFEILSFNQSAIEKPSISGTSFDNALFFKGFLLNAFNKGKEIILNYPEAVEKFNLLKSYDRRLASEYSKPISERKGIDELEEKSNTLEKELASKVAGFGESIKQVKWQEIKEILKLEEVAIEFVSYQYVGINPTDSIMYTALSLNPRDTSPLFIPLFEEKELNQLLNSSSARKMDYVASIYQSADGRGAIPIQEKSKSLFDLIWKPLEPYLKGVKTIYFSPSGLLHRINQNAIAIDDHTLLSDKYDLVQLGSTRQLVFKDEKGKAKLISASIYGGINFEMDSTEMLASIQPRDSSFSVLRSELSFSYTDSTLRGGTWQYLKGSEQEATEIHKIFNKAKIKSAFYHGNDATEESFKQLGDYKKESPQILHISTHGYFFPDPKKEVGSSQLSVGREEPVFKISEHPMMRSGLILAGANHAWKTGKPIRPDMEDGILTAYEISHLNLRNTELVVLSACETGLGDIQGNEGVYGLQRAFKIAGAKNLIMSLWQVPDQQTNELMTTFYKYWLIKKKTIRQALQLAQKDLRRKGLEPFYWAGFVLVE